MNLCDQILQQAKIHQEKYGQRLLSLECVYYTFLEAKENPAIYSVKIDEKEAFYRICKSISENLIAPKTKIEQILQKEMSEASLQNAKAFAIWLKYSAKRIDNLYRYVIDHIDIAQEEDDLDEYDPDEYDLDFVINLDDPDDSAADSNEELPDKKDGVPSIEELTSNTVKLREALLGSVIGQNNAVCRFADGYFQGELTSRMGKHRKGPKAVFLFAGSPGVGKTFLATQAAEIIGITTKRFDMSGYSDTDAAFDLTGAGSNYKHPAPGALSGFVEENPQSILIFDEIEKAHKKAIHLFLQILDTGFLYDNYLEKNVSFKDTIIIFTTNAGKELYQNPEKRNLSDIPKKVILNALANDINPDTGSPYFPEAICSRMSAGFVVMFNHLSAADLIQIAEKQIMNQENELKPMYEVASENCRDMASTILYSLGGHCDARNLNGAVKQFFSGELLELFRLSESKKRKGCGKQIRKISWSVDLEGCTEDVQNLYRIPSDSITLFFGDESKRIFFEKNADSKWIFTSTLEEAHEILKEREVSFAVIDYLKGKNDGKNLLNAEDVGSDGKILFHEMKEAYRDIPVLILEDEYKYDREEIISFLNRGAYDVISISNGDIDEIKQKINEYQISIHQEKVMEMLAMKNQVLSYETSQTVSKDGTEGEISLFALRLTTAVDADERKDVVSAAERPNVKWDDVIISDDAREELQYFQGYLKNPNAFIKKGAKAPKGILLYGPPGTGKTTLAKVMASETDVTFLSVSADQFFRKWAGEGPETVHRIFSIARKYAPAILFIDEIDAIGGRREDGNTGGGRLEILNALLTEMDGFKTSVKKPVLVIAATNLGGNNQKSGFLDPALVRRFDRSIHIELPDRQGREKFLRLLCRKNPGVKISDEKIRSLAERSVGMSPALLEGAMNAAVREGIRNDCEVNDEIMDEAFEKYNNGDEKKWDSSELLKTARHEAGHAFLSYYYGEKPSYLTIVARDNHGGYMMHSGAEQKGCYSKKELLHRISISMGGRASEIVFYGDEDGLTTGSSGDLENATRIANAMVCSYGMYPEISMGVISEKMLMAGMFMEVNRCINRIIYEQTQDAVELIRSHQDKLNALVDALMDKSYLTKEQIEAILE